MQPKRKPGRPTEAPLTERAYLRLTPAEKSQYLALGGSLWVHKMLDKSDQPAVMDEREAFERGINSHCRRRNEHGDYVVPAVQDRWDGWQARAILQEPKPEA